jgi:hypothetical protein
MLKSYKLFLKGWTEQTLKFNQTTDTVEYLGHICTPLGIRPDPRKIRAIEEYPVPKTIRDIRAFIGLAGYYRRHV